MHTVESGTGRSMVRLRIAQMCQEKGVSKSALARMANISMWEARALYDPEFNVGIKTLGKVAAALGVRVCDLIEEDEGEEHTKTEP